MSLDRPAAFRTLDAGPSIALCIDGQQVNVPEHISVAAALLLTRQGTMRTTALSQSPRAPYCMMGVCFECLVEIDGQTNRQACLETVVPGMQVRTQQGTPAFPQKNDEARDVR